ncbi:MAG: hypothetical protein ACM3ZE_05660 [Myxococcales bacterium]
MPRLNARPRGRIYLMFLAPILCAVGLYALNHRDGVASEQRGRNDSRGVTAEVGETIDHASAQHSMLPGAQANGRTEDQTGEASPTTTSNPQLGAPAIESPEVIDTMDVEFVRDEIRRIDKELGDRKAVERLNNGEVSETERLELGAMMERVALFRHRLAKDTVNTLTEEVANYEKAHEERVAEYSNRLDRLKKEKHDR